MISRCLKWSINVPFTLVLAGSFLVTTASRAQDKAEPEAGKIPNKVMNALKARFPNPEIQTWTREKEGGIVLYDIEFKQGGQKFEADIKEDGTIHNCEKEIPVKDLPAAVRKTVDARYRNAAIKEVMSVTAVKDGKDAPEGYEITVETAAGKSVEITVAPDGKVLEEPGEKK